MKGQFKLLCNVGFVCEWETQMFRNREIHLGDMKWVIQMLNTQCILFLLYGHNARNHQKFGIILVYCSGKRWTDEMWGLFNLETPRN